MSISQICYNNHSYFNIFNPSWNCCAIKQISAFVQSNYRSPIYYSSVKGNRLTQVKGNRLTQAIIELIPHHPAASKSFRETDSSAQPKFLSNKPKVVLAFLEKFTKEFRWVRTFDKDYFKTMGTDLFQIVPKNFELLVNLIFEKNNQKDIRLLLDAIAMRNPKPILSPYNQIRKAIIEDEEQHLTNDDLTSMFKEYKLENNKEKILSCYNLAFRINHPYIYQIAQKAILDSDYTLNFLWINLNPQNRIQDLAQNIFMDGINSFESAKHIIDSHKLRAFERTEQALEKDVAEQWQQVKKTISYKISRWADAHPYASINLWYDSALVTQNAQLKTFESMREISQSRGVHLRLRDVRHLSNVQGEIENSLHPGTPLYYRIDLLKALITDYMLSSHEENAKYFIFSDIDIEPMTSDQIFDQRTLDYLSSYGYVFNRVGVVNVENSFFIFNKEKQDIQKIHNRDIIQKMVSLIEELRPYPLNTEFPRQYILGSQAIFNLYFKFRENMNGPDASWDGFELEFPRKVVKGPKSQFDFEGNFRKSDYQSETFRFIGNENVPYTKFGRNFDKYADSEKQIDALKNWKAEPLTTPVSYTK